MLPELVLLTDEPVEEGLKGVENANVKGRVRGLGQLDVAPLEEDIKDLLEHLRLGRDQTDDLLRDLDVLVEVLREHLFADFVAEDGFALHFDAIDLVGLQLFMHPSDLCILLRPFLLASRVDREPLFFRGRFRFKRRGGRGRLRHLALRQIEVGLRWRCLYLRFYLRLCPWLGWRCLLRGRRLLCLRLWCFLLFLLFNSDAGLCSLRFGLLQNGCHSLLDSWLEVQGPVHERLKADEAHHLDDNFF